MNTISKTPDSIIADRPWPLFYFPQAPLDRAGDYLQRSETADA